MNLLLLPTMVLFGLTLSFDYDLSLDNTETCVVDEDTNSYIPFVECKCPKRENFTFGSMLVYNINKITISGCGIVHLGFDALSNLHLEKLIFIDIYTLIIGPFTLSLAQGIETLEITLIPNLVIEKHAFVGLRNVDTLLISYVGMSKLSRDAFSSISDVRFISIENSAFDHVEQLAFSAHNVTVVKVYNSNFSFMENGSFFIMASEEVRFEDCSFEETNNGTFIVSQVDSLYFQHCQFGNLASKLIQGNEVRVFNLSNSRIEVLETNAFADLQVSEKIIFKHNIIPIAYEDSLDSIISPALDYIEVDFSSNIFTCDCNIYWMWKLKKQKSVLENNFCLEDPMRTISQYIPIIDSNNNCMTLELKSSENDLFTNATYKPMEHSKAIGSNGSNLDFLLFIITICLIFSYKSIVL